MVILIPVTPSFPRNTVEIPPLELSEPVKMIYCNSLYLTKSNCKYSDLKPSNFGYFQNVNPASRTRVVHHSNYLHDIALSQRLKKWQQTMFVLLTALSEAQSLTHSMCVTNE